MFHNFINVIIFLHVMTLCRAVISFPRLVLYAFNFVALTDENNMMCFTCGIKGLGVAVVITWADDRRKGNGFKEFNVKHACRLSNLTAVVYTSNDLKATNQNGLSKPIIWQ